jgi:hypothetical protein
MDPMDRLCAGITPAQGRLCRSKIEKVVADVPLCRSHLQKITDALGQTPRSVISGVVYYLGDPDTQQVKIGSSTRLPVRFATIAGQRPNVRLLAVEPGYTELEKRRHREWRRHRVSHHGGNREWYHKTPEMMQWINDVRKAHGDPWAHPAVTANR